MGNGATESHRLALPMGYQLGRYRIESQLGFGSFGITYLAHDLTLPRRVAIKELLPTMIVSRYDTVRVAANSSNDEAQWQWAQRRFLEEASALAACQHPNILHVYDVFPENGTAYMVTRYEEGSALTQWLKQLGRRPTEAELRGILEPLLSALEVVHAQGFLHRDIKPDNIYMAGSRPMLIDFGSARQDVTNRSVPVTAIVTEGYAPFEQYTEAGQQGPWTDLYALGAVLYGAITGRKPPTATHRATADVDPLQPLSGTWDREYSRPFLASIDAALRQRPADRLRSTAQWQGLLSGASGYVPAPPSSPYGAGHTHYPPPPPPPPPAWPPQPQPQGGWSASPPPPSPPYQHTAPSGFAPPSAQGYSQPAPAGYAQHHGPQGYREPVPHAAQAPAGQAHAHGQSPFSVLGTLTTIFTVLSLLLTALTVYFGMAYGLDHPTLDDYKFRTPEEAIRSPLQIEMDASARAFEELTRTCLGPSLRKRIETLQIAREEDFDGKKLLFISYYDQARQKTVYDVQGMTLDTDTGQWRSTYVSSYSIPDSQQRLKDSMKSWEEKGILP